MQTGYVTKSILCDPITSGDTLLGVIQILNKKGGLSFDFKDEGKISILSKQIASTLIMHADRDENSTATSYKGDSYKGEGSVTSSPLYRSRGISIGSITGSPMSKRSPSPSHGMNPIRIGEQEKRNNVITRSKSNSHKP